MNEQDKRALVAMYMSKAGKRSIDDPVTRSVRGLPQGGIAQAPAQEGGPSRRQQAMIAAFRERQRQQEIERMDRVNNALVYSDVLARPGPGMIRAADLGMSATEGDPRGMLIGLDPGQLQEGDLEWLRAQAAARGGAK